MESENATPPPQPGASGEPNPRPLLAQQEHLDRAFSEQGIDGERVRRVIAAFVADLKSRGNAPEAVLVALKTLLARQEAPPPDGPEAIRAFRAAKDNSDLYGAIVTLAIAQYYAQDPA